MRIRRVVALSGLCGLVLAAALLTSVRAQQGAPAPQVAVDADDIGGIVTGPNGPEAGVWVIAETETLSTPLKKIVVTDDAGRYLLPDLPQATYRVWVRGYGLVDSPAVEARPGDTRTLTAVLAPNARAAAQYYPANYWYSLLEVPEAREFPGTGPQGNGIDPAITTQHEWISRIKAGCNVCHQLGNAATREIPPVFAEGRSSVEAWHLRVQSGQDGAGMSNAATALGRDRALKMFADWTDRIAAGAVPAVAPPRPQGVERNLVLTLWDWGGTSTFAHDELSTDKRNPTANARGPIYGVDWGNDAFLILDPRTNEATQLRVPVLDPDTPPGKAQRMPVPSAYWGNQLYWYDPAIPNHAAMDSKGRVWMSGRFRKPEDQPQFCRAHPSARLAPMETGFRQLQYFDPQTRQFHQVDICFDTHHVAFAGDADETIYGNGPFAGAIGWVKTRVLEETGDLAAAQGWCQGYFDIDGNGRVDPAVDRPIPMGGVYSVIPNNADGSVWGAVLNPMPGKIVRIDPATCVGEAYEPPFGAGVTTTGYTPRGIDIDENGVIWTGLAGSGHLASFDRRRCEVRSGPQATGQHCPEGWTLYRQPGPSFRNAPEDIATGFIYYNFVDRFDTLGLGRNVPLATGTTSDSLLALVDGKWVDLRVPYPMGFFSRGLDGRIDDPDAGWKGRGIYANYGPNAVWHIEGGLGTRSKLVRFQLRPDPLAR
ncbi:MAG: carboxypeptidase regulatory-like domain-containing protein [Acidobacteria bacterium]|nr:carboxypeptidase regulatory-like domain-containing protein [Acidobacteriota bacterium]